jgi:hypothetical protein
VTGIRRRNRGSTRRTRIGALLAVVALVAFTQISASAELKLPELPLPTSAPLLDDPLNLEDLLNLDELLNSELPVSTDLGEVVEGVTEGVSNVLGGSGSPTDVLGGQQQPEPAPAKKVAPGVPQTGSWSTDRLLLPSGLTGPSTQVSSTRVPAVSYVAAIGQGFARAARRAADLAGPVAAPMLLGLFAVGLLFVAARGPGRLIKVEEERKAFREQRTFRL